MPTPLLLTPRIYRPNLRWSLLPQNKIDTVDASPILDDIKNELIHTHEIPESEIRKYQGTLDGWANGEQTSNFRHESTFADYMGASVVVAYTIKGSYDVSFENPPASFPTVRWSVDGTTEYLERNGGQTPGNKSSDEAVNLMQDIAKNLTVANAWGYFDSHSNAGVQNFVDSAGYDNHNRAAFRDGLLIDYKKGRVPIYAWIREVTGTPPSSYTVAQYLQSRYRPTEADVFTIWNNNPDNASEWLPRYDAWITTKGNFNQPGVIKQGPYRWLLASGDNQDGYWIPIIPTYVNFSCKVEKLSGVDFRVNYELPAGYVYLAAAICRGNIVHSNIHGSDSYGFRDKISGIKIEMYADTYNTAAQDNSWRRQDNGTIVDSLNNPEAYQLLEGKHPLAFDENELIKSTTEWGNQKWVDRMPKYILDTYKQGKYIVECTVSAKWAFENAVRVGTQVQVMLQGGAMLARKASNDADAKVCTFTIKNIERSFRDSEFVYNLKMIEQ